VGANAYENPNYTYRKGPLAIDLDRNFDPRGGPLFGSCSFVESRKRLNREWPTIWTVVFGPAVGVHY